MYMKTNKLNKIREKLKDRVIKIVAKESGVHSNTIYSIVNTNRSNVSESIINKLNKYLGIK